MVDETTLQAILSESAHKHRVPGASIAIESQNRRVLATTGVLNTETKDPVLAESLFQIGSVTKVLTATLIMMLVDEGLLSLDDPVAEYIPGFRLLDTDRAKKITVGQLISHTSGIDGDFMSDTGSGPDRLARYVDRCALLPNLYEPGQGFSYSNAAFCIAGRIIERMYRLPFDEVMQQCLFERMGLKQSIGDLTLMPSRSLASAHVLDPSDLTRNMRLPHLFSLPLSAAPAGSTVMMSANDLLEFARMHFDGGVAGNGERVMTSDSAIHMQNIQISVPVPFRGITHWGLGWFLLFTGGRCVYGHDGAAVGQMGFVRVDPETGTLIALLTNGGNGNDFMSDVFDATFYELADIANPVSELAEQECDDLARYEGCYRNIGGDTRFEVVDGSLVRTAITRIDNITMPAGPNTLLYVGDHQFKWSPPTQIATAPVSFLGVREDRPASTIFAGLRLSRRIEVGHELWLHPLMPLVTTAFLRLMTRERAGLANLLMK